MNEQRRVLVAGYYGFGNTGDEAILSRMIQGLRPCEAQITVVSGDPERTSSEHSVVAAVHWQNMDAIVEAVRRSQLVLVGGGGLFQEYWGFDPADVLTHKHANIGYWAGLAALASLARKPLMLYAVGVGPLRSELGRRFTRATFELADCITLRDEGSRDLVVSLGVDPTRVVVTADPVHGLALSAGSTPAREEAGLSVGVAVRPWTDGVDPDSWLRALAGGLDAFLDRHPARVILVPFHESSVEIEDDLAIAKRLGRLLRHEARVVAAGEGFEAKARALGACELGLAMRLHAVLFAAGAGVPTLALAYDKKVRAAMGQLGREEHSIDLGELSSEQLSRQLETVYDRRELIGKQLRDVSAELAQRAAENDRLALELLERGRDQRPRPVEPLIQILEQPAFRRLAQGDERGRRSDVLQAELAQLQSERDRLAVERDRLATDREAMLQTRAWRSITRYWRIRDSLKLRLSVARQTLLRGIASVLRRLARLVGSERDWEGLLMDTRSVRSRDELRQLLLRYPDARDVVIFPPTIGWDIPLFQRPQQMALALARLGYLVLFNLGPDNAEQVLGWKEIDERLILAHLPDDCLEVYRDMASPVVITYTYNCAWSRFLTKPRIVYELIDELLVFSESFPERELRRWHRQALKKAHVVVGTADALVRQMKPERPDAILCPNGVDYAHFHDFQRESLGAGLADMERIVARGNTIVGFYGALAEWLDYRLIAESADILSDHDFVFIGPDYAGTVATQAGVFERPNVHWLGPRPYADLPGYLHHFDVATVPFKLDQVTHAVSPLKLFEYMAGGRPVVTTDLRECRKYPGVLVSRDSKEYVENLSKAPSLMEDASYRATLDETARSNTWESRVETIMTALAAVTSGRANVRRSG